MGALLNTSNLHGLPIVRTVQDAFYVFENSDLDGLVVESFLFIKKSEISNINNRNTPSYFFCRASEEQITLMWFVNTKL